MFPVIFEVDSICFIWKSMHKVCDCNSIFQVTCTPSCLLYVVLLEKDDSEFDLIHIEESDVFCRVDFVSQALNTRHQREEVLSKGRPFSKRQIHLHPHSI